MTGPGDLLGHVEFAVLDAVNRGALRSRRTARKVRVLGEHPAGEAMLHEALVRGEHDGLLRSERDASGRRYDLTAAGHARLRADRRFRFALAGLLAPPRRQAALIPRYRLRIAAVVAGRLFG